MILLVAPLCIPAVAGAVATAVGRVAGDLYMVVLRGTLLMVLVGGLLLAWIFLRDQRSLGRWLGGLAAGCLWMAYLLAIITVTLTSDRLLQTYRAGMATTLRGTMGIEGLRRWARELPAMAADHDLDVVYPGADSPISQVFKRRPNSILLERSHPGGPVQVKILWPGMLMSAGLSIDPVPPTTAVRDPRRTLVLAEGIEVFTNR